MTWNGNLTVNDTGNVSATLTSLTRQSGEGVGTYNVTGGGLSVSGSAARLAGAPLTSTVCGS